MTIDRRTMLAWAASMPMIGCRSDRRDRIRVAAASSLATVADDLTDAWRSATSDDHRVDWTFAASGILAIQIAAGLPADIFLAADRRHADRIAQTIAAATPVADYAVGQLVWYPGKPATAPESIAIADPATAPYGAASMQTIESMRWRETRIVQAASAAAVVQMVDADAAPVGLTAASLIATSSLGGRTQDIAVDPSMHDPIRHAGLCLSPRSTPAMSFWQFLRGVASDPVWQRHGFEAVNRTDV